MNNDDALIVSVCVILPLLILIAVIVVIYLQLSEQKNLLHRPKVEPISPKTDYCKLHRQYCEMDIILLRYEHVKLRNIDCTDEQADELIDECADFDALAEKVAEGCLPMDLEEALAEFIQCDEDIQIEAYEDWKSSHLPTSR